MNIFKVLASGKKSFQEETASAVIAWFFNPMMEHGLGYTFLEKFIEGISQANSNHESLMELTEALTPRLRNRETTQNIWFDLEYNAGRFIDIIFGVNDWVFAIENKIYLKSVSDNQLTEEYQGLKKKDNFDKSKICILYLAPIQEDATTLPPSISKELDKVILQGDDVKAVVTWQRNKIDNVPSITEIITTILGEESKGIIDPISEYTRHTLKALNAFIANDFSGYEYESKNKYSGKNPSTEEVLPIDLLKNKSIGYVGVFAGISGLLNLNKNKIKSKEFQFTSQDMQAKSNWIDITTFCTIIDFWFFGKQLEKIDWIDDLKLPAKTIYEVAKIANNYEINLYIGIWGGEKGLLKLKCTEIEQKKWTVSTDKKTVQWISGKVFCDILNEKKVFQ